MTTMPSHNAEGIQVWNPSVGTYFKPAANKRESYGGIIGALQDQLVSQGSTVKAYPENFAGIISAIQDLTFTQKEPPVDPDVRPPGGDVIIDSDGDYDWVWAEVPRDGTLWYDTRQGRMFIAIDGEYYQTNGADGLAQVTQDSEEPQTPVVGQFWWDLDTASLYIFDGFWRNPEGEIKDNFQPGYTPVWRLVVSDSSSAVTTATLPLAYNSRNQSGLILPDVDEPNMNNQSDFNGWLHDSLEALEAAIQSGEYSSVQIDMGTTPPADPDPGDLWYDTEALELSIYYQDSNTSQWVPTSVTYNYDDQINFLNTQLLIERQSREDDVLQLNGLINTAVSSSSQVQSLNDKLVTLEVEVAARPLIDTSVFATNTNAAALGSRISILETATSNLNALQTIASAQAEHTALHNAIAALPTRAELDTVSALIPSITGLTTTEDVAAAISNITVEYLPRTGGTLSGSFISEKQDMAQATFDFSGQKWYGYNTHKYLTNSIQPHYATFGTNEKFYEYAWNFSSEEDFCWVYNNTDKVFSITKDGPACSTLYLADIDSNTTNGRQLSNKIDVKDRLVKYQSAFEQMRQGIANATDFDSLKANILSSLASV
jgi:hypothetical protein